MQRKVPSAIANITLNRATFTDVLIDGLTFVNFFYGNNGAGKSSIAHAILQSQEHSHPNYPGTTSRLPIYIFLRPTTLKRNSVCTVPVPLSNGTAQTYNHLTMRLVNSYRFLRRRYPKPAVSSPHWKAEGKRNPGSGTTLR